ncbi:MAG: beta-lactamase family protein [Saprospiraceae bacterium]|jgi:CubicO group peptidase (beta-lactamase class C family)|nr:beta-lactamase family protein [Saprospiraceae bacterium]MBK8512664.1 beta-lactamase family protein [Saprospiraceae bacterium]MBK9678437.1 beta-lactamase family protein [Saprospiraceae bacterium]MBP7800262.1 beta-lactamase family protein [Saprospiraceae bacterium]MBP8093870.1 beta-lactamase family protein [Saprospiraceae bacterium]
MRIFILFILIGGLNTGLAQKDPIRKELNRLIKYETDIDFKSTPGFIIGMIDEDTSFVYSFGQRAVDDPGPITKDDQFEIGGVTKVFTALLVETLADKGLLDLSKPINEFLPFANPSFDHCTLFNLLTHTSGLPKLPPGWGLIEDDSRNPYAAFSQKDLESFYRSYSLQDPSSSTYLYSHLNYVMIEWILQSVFDKSYAQLFKENLPADLVISLDSSTTIAGYDRQTRPVKPWTSQTFGAALGGKASLHTLLNLTYLFLYPPTPAYLALIHPQQTSIRGEKGWVAPGWQVVTIPGERFLYVHTGRTEGHHAFVGLLPDTHTAVVVLANSASGTELLGLSVLRMMNKNWKRKGG